MAHPVFLVVQPWKLTRWELDELDLRLEARAQKSQVRNRIARSVSWYARSWRALSAWSFDLWSEGGGANELEQTLFNHVQSIKTHMAYVDIWKLTRWELDELRFETWGRGGQRQREKLEAKSEIRIARSVSTGTARSWRALSALKLRLVKRRRWGLRMSWRQTLFNHVQSIKTHMAYVDICGRKPPNHRVK